MAETKKRRSRRLPKTASRGELPERIVSAALGLLRTQGPSGITYREIAAAAGVSHMAPYRYFRTKEDILARIAEIGFDRLNQSLQAALDAFPIEPEKQLARAALSYFEFARRYPAHYRLMFVENGTLSSGAGEATFSVFRQMIRNCQMAGVLSAVRDAEELAFHLWSYVHGASTLQLSRPLTVLRNLPEPRVTIARGLEAFIGGLRGLS